MEIECVKCKAWDMAAKEFGYSSGMCDKCFNEQFFLLNSQPERSKREDHYIGGYFPPPWNPNEHPEKTEGWIAFQEEQRKAPKYYGCGALNIVETQ